jgi:hypothetical protein
MTTPPKPEDPSDSWQPTKQFLSLKRLIIADELSDVNP